MSAIIGVKGLNPSDNPLELEPGTLLRGDNVVLRNRGSVEPRLGENYYLGPDNPSPVAARIAELYVWGDAIIAHLRNNTLANPPAGVFVGTFQEPMSQRVKMKFAEAAKNLYFTASDGVWGLTSVFAQPVKAGAPRAPDLDFVASRLTGAPNAGWMEPNSQVAGRSVFGIKDANGNLKLGVRSARLIITNPGNQALLAGALVRAGGNTVTWTSPVAHGYQVGDTFDLQLSPADANFPNGAKTVVTVPSPVTLTYTEVGANGPSVQPGTISSGGKNILWRIPLPPGITTSHFFRLYRGATSATAATPPDDELFLVFEGVITAPNIAAGFVDFTDRTPESVLGLFGSEPLYTNPNTGDGALAARFKPPRAVDMLWWSDRLWFANTKDVARFTITLLGIGAPDGLQDGDSLFISIPSAVQGTFTARIAPGLPTEFKLYTDGSASQNIERTARALIAAVRANAPDIQAFYASGADDAPGAIQFEVNELLFENIAIQATRLTAWTPALTGVASVDQSPPGNNKLRYSEVGLPESVPLLNELSLGSADSEILRILPLRDKMLVMTSNRGLFLVSGQFPYRVDPLDPTVHLRQPDTAKTHGGLVYAYTTHGVVAISEGGVRIIDMPLQEPLRDFEVLGVGGGWPATSNAFALSREALHEYHLFLPTGFAEDCPEAYVYNSASDSWYHRTGNRTCAAELRDGRAIYGDGDETQLLRERLPKEWAPGSDGERAWGMAEKELRRNVVTSADYTVELDSVAGVAAGDLLAQNFGFAGEDIRRSVIEEVDATATTVRVASLEAWAVGAVYVEKAIPQALQFVPDTGGTPDIIKQPRGLLLHFKRLATLQAEIANNEEPGQVNATFFSEQMQGEAPVRIDNAGYGLTPYGSGSWGSPLGPADERVSVPQEFHRARQPRAGLTVLQAGCRWELLGHSFEVVEVSERSR